MPVHNGATCVEECIRSVVLQIQDDAELVIVENGSTDNTYQICERYLLEDKDHIRLIHLDKASLSEARNCGLKQARGEYVWFVDADDTVSDFALSALKDCINKTDNPDVIIFNYLSDIKTENGREKLNEYYAINQTDALNGCFDRNRWGGYVWNKLYKRNILLHLQFDRELIEDLLFNVRLFHEMTCEGKIIYLSSKLYFYQITPNSASHSFSDKQLQVIDTYHLIEQIINNHPAYGFARKVIKHSIVNQSRYILEYYWAKQRQAYGNIRNEYVREIRSSFDETFSFKEKLIACVTAYLPWMIPILRKLSH